VENRGTNLDEFLSRFCGIDGVEAVLLAGSRTTGSSDKGSDYDIYVYGSRAVDAGSRRQAIEPLASYAEIDNRYWETEDDWIMKDGDRQPLLGNRG